LKTFYEAADAAGESNFYSSVAAASLQLVLLSLLLLLSDLTALVIIIEPSQRSPKMFEQYSVLKTSPAKPQKKKIPNLIPK
jgi:hypothetical protein